ncbi:diguanylate cyclase domain-containing protein [Dechloromonas sp. A34]|uniref:diguanylate cyclase domain-containing protein n=1 Tax=Dechloromonas sp. A34 TaxID=447588 RepID=UPI002248F15D|nr:diguanylate cyclase [Dechloromonas sp. A34]
MNEFARPSPRHWESDSHIRVPTQPSQILLWLTDAEGRIEFLSPSWSRFTGQERPALIADGWAQVVHPDDLASLHGAFQRAARENQGFRRHVWLRRRDGIYCGMAFESLPRIAPSGETVGFTGFCLDLSPAVHALPGANPADHRIAELLKQIRLPATVIDLDGQLIFFNQPFLDLIDEPPREAISRPFFGHYAEAIDEPPAERLRKVADTPPHAFECAVRDTAGRSHLMSWHVTALRDESGQMTCSVLIGEDITAQRQKEEEWRLTQRVFETTDEAMVVTDSKAQIIAVNQAFTRLTGYTREEAIGLNPRVLQSGRHDQAFYEEMWRTLSENGHWQGDIWDLRKDGTIYPKFLSISTLRDSEGKATHYCGIFYDITERKTFEDKLERLAHYDVLTGIPNRSLLFDRLELATAEAMHSGGKAAVLFIDLDRFKNINDSLGHAAGDQVLREAATRICSTIRRNDTAARLGGDEFAIVLPDLDDPQHAALVAEKIIECMRTPFLIDGAPVTVSTSIGISLFPADHHQPDKLLELADQAMYKVKARGANGYQFCSDPGTAPA